MKFTSGFQRNIYNLMRQAGYHPEAGDEKTGEPSFIRRLGTDDYPRFHAYVSRETSEINLHLDQKKPSYEGATAHSGEYDGELVEKEAERIKRFANS